jgi:proline iminopeptidase
MLRWIRREEECMFTLGVAPPSTGRRPQPQPTALPPAGTGTPRGSGPWSDARVRLAVGLLAPVGLALASALLTPRGPITAAEGLATMVGALAAGAIAGFALRSRSALLVAPLAFVAVFEVARSGTAGPTVDGIRFSTYGAVAFATGRGVYGLLALVPMALGAAVGAAIARHLLGVRAAPAGWRRAGLYARRGLAGLVGAGLVLLALAIARPATTDPIPGPNGEPLPGSVAELTRVEVDGHDLALMIRGHSTASPVLLFLAGGPGGTELGAMRRHLQALERDFVVVTWDQRGSGKSYGSLDPVSTLTLESSVRDTIAITNHLRERFGQERIYLVGQSWGTILGVRAVQERPELYRAFVGVGQMVSPSETDRIFHADILAWARATGKDDLAATLTESGPPPYGRLVDYEPLLLHEKDVYAYDRSRNAEGAGQMGENIFVEEYTLLEQLRAFAGVVDTFAALYPRIQHVDFRRDARELDVPVYLVQGRHEARGRAEPAREWFDALRAPSKRLLVFETSGHRPLWEQPDRFHHVMKEIVLAETRADPEQRRSP